MTPKFRGKTAIAGIGQTPLYKRATSPDSELKLCLRAIVAACEDAGISPQDIDGFVSYGSERSSGQKLMAGLGTKELRFDSLMWTHGGGVPGVLGLAAAAIISGQAEIVVAYRSMAERSNQRLRVAVAQNDTSPQYLVNGLEAPAQTCAIRSQRLFEYDGVPGETMRAMAMASYYHANRNPAATGYKLRLDEETYEHSRLIAEPYHLFDCSRENDGAAAVIVVSAERARDLAQTPAYILSAPSGAGKGWGAVQESREPYTSAGFGPIAKRLWSESGYTPADVDVAQIYSNFAGLAVAAIIDHGFCTHETAGEFITFDNLIAPTGRFPVNTSGGDLAEGFLHGATLVPEAVRQLRGISTNQVASVNLSLITGGPGDLVTSSALLGSESTL